MAGNGVKGFDVKRVGLLAAGAVVVSLIALVVQLYVCGMLSLSAPHLRPAPGYAMADSILASWEAKKAADETAAETAIREGAAGQLPTAGESPEPAASTADTAAEAQPQTGSGPEEAGTSLAPAESDSAGAGGEVGEPLLPFDETKLARLVRVYEKMRPKQVAIILMTMPDQQAVTILSHMKENKAAQVLAEMEAGKAARISQALVNWSDDER
jgi:hypothetical protein